MLSYGTYAGVLFGPLAGIITIGAIILLKVSLTRLVGWLEAVFHFKTIRTIGDDYALIDVCDDKFELTTTIRSRLPFVFVLGTSILVAILVFIEGCIFSTRHIYSQKECSIRTPNCYLFQSDLSYFKPLYEFVCEPGLPVIPSNMSASYAVCYGFVLPDQSSIDLLNQLGVCTGLLELVRFMYPWAYKFGRGRKGRIGLLIFICMLIMIEIIVLTIQLNVSFTTIILLTLVEVLMINIFILHYKRVRNPASLHRVGSYIPLIDVN